MIRITSVIKYVKNRWEWLVQRTEVGVGWSSQQLNPLIRAAGGGGRGGGWHRWP